MPRGRGLGMVLSGGTDVVHRVYLVFESGWCILVEAVKVYLGYQGHVAALSRPYGANDIARSHSVSSEGFMKAGNKQMEPRRL